MVMLNRLNVSTKKKIDGAIAMLEALGSYLLVPRYSNEMIIV